MDGTLLDVSLLLERITPGPWEPNVLGSVLADRAPVLLDADRRRMSVMAARSPTRSEAQANIRLASMAPELARTVVEQAEQLARFRQWAKSLCDTECRETLSKYGRHTPNCPVADLGMDRDSTSTYRNGRPTLNTGSKE